MKTRRTAAADAALPAGTPGEVFLVFLRLGLTSFGGPVAHLGYFREDIVARRRWLSEDAYATLVALCQFLPGPASSQVGMAIGLLRAGTAGMMAAWLGFTLPSALLMLAFAYGVTHAGAAGIDGGWLAGLKIAAAAVVADAVLGMARNLCPDRPRRTLALLTAAGAAIFPGALGQLGIIAFGALAGLTFLSTDGAPAKPPPGHLPGRTASLVSLALFALLLAGLPLLAQASGDGAVALFDTLYRAGALVFGGGHVVLPLLQSEVVTPGWSTNEAFLAGYGVAQAVPGPLFTFAAYLGAVMGPAPNGFAGAIIALVAVFLPGLLLVYGMLPFWDALRLRPTAQAAMRGANAAVVGILGAALYSPVWTSAVLSPPDFALALAGFLLLTVWKAQPWIVVLVLAAGGTLLHLI